MHNRDLEDTHLSPYLDEETRLYRVRHLSSDIPRLNEYQRLRAAIFAHGRGWQIPVDEHGRERDRYDEPDERWYTNSFGVYGEDVSEHLLGGVRVLSLPTWDHSMVMNEFASMFHESALRTLRSMRSQDILEITRFCVRRGHWYPANQRFRCAVARDLTYAALYAVVSNTQRTLGVGVADPAYMRVIQRGHFAVTALSVTPNAILFLVDLEESIRAIRLAGDEARAQRMLFLCPGSF